MEQKDMRAAAALRWVLAAALLAALPSIPSCGECFERSIEVTLPARLQADGQDTSVALGGRVTDANVSPSSYDLLVQLVSDASAAPPHVLVWTFDAGPAVSVVGFLAFQMSLPVQRGASIPVALSSRFGGWGAQPQSRPPGASTASVYYERGDFAPTSVAGTLVVLGTSPLRLQVELTFRNVSGRVVRIDGVMQFTVLSKPVRCFE